uniref:Uncharacterized protein n=1 Tax=Nothobranchius pienaari TaxID=704102 RepID=A0A1A8L3E6_9TELE
MGVGSNRTSGAKTHTQLLRMSCCSDLLRDNSAGFTQVSVSHPCEVHSSYPSSPPSKGLDCGLQSLLSQTIIHSRGNRRRERSDHHEGTKRDGPTLSSFQLALKQIQ